MSDFFETIAIRMDAMQNVLIAGPLVGAACSMLSVYVVLRRMSLISEGVSHAGFGGMGLAVLGSAFVPFLAGRVWQQVVAGLFCVGTALLIGYVTRRKRVSEDAAIGIFLVASMALGHVFLSIHAHMPGAAGPSKYMSVENLLFGAFLAVGPEDVATAAGAFVCVAAMIVFLYHQLLYTTLDEEMARINGVNTRLVNVLLLVMISAVIVASVRMVGFLIITALMIIPGATAAMISRRFGTVMIWSVAIGTLGTAVATFIALVPPFSRYPSGSFVVIVLFLIFAGVWTWRHFFKPRAETLEPADGGGAVQSVRGFGHGHAH